MPDPIGYLASVYDAATAGNLITTATAGRDGLTEIEAGVLAYDTDYWVDAVALADPAGTYADSAPSLRTYVRTQEEPPDKPPQKPLLTVGAVEQTSIEIVWTIPAPDDGHDAPTALSLKMATGTQFVEINRPAIGNGSYNKTDLTANTQYKFRLDATNPYGETQSGVLTRKTAPIPKPPWPPVLSGDITLTGGGWFDWQANLDWTIRAPDDDHSNPTEILVYAATEAGGAFSRIDTLAGSARSATEPGAGFGGSMWYYITAGNVHGVEESNTIMLDIPPRP